MEYHRKASTVSQRWRKVGIKEGKVSESLAQCDFSLFLSPLKCSQLLSVLPHRAIATQFEERKPGEGKNKVWEEKKQVSKGYREDMIAGWDQRLGAERGLWRYS